LDAYDPDGTPIANVKEGTYHFEKISYQVSSGNRLSGFYHENVDIELRNASKFIPRESMVDKDNPVWMTKAEWQTVRGNTLVASVQVGAWDFKRYAVSRRGSRRRQTLRPSIKPAAISPRRLPQ
jgi:hypothetical protein